MIQPTRTSTNSALLTGNYIVSKVILNGGTADSSVILDDSTNGTGTEKLKVKALANSSQVVNISEGLRFGTGVYATLAGSGAEVYVYYK